jgi:hypothetical protein
VLALRRPEGPTGCRADKRAVRGVPLEVVVVSKETTFESLESQSQLRGFGSGEFTWSRCSSARR